MSAERAAVARPLPDPGDPLTEQFYLHCARGELCFQRCASCGAWRHLPRFLCARCGSAKWSWEQSSGRGKIFSWTVTHQALHPAFAADVPYAIAIVEMEEGVRLVSRVVGAGAAALALDLPVAVEFERVAEAVALPVFRVDRGVSQQRNRLP
jgi:uncharacterized OB-fold protein